MIDKPDAISLLEALREQYPEASRSTIKKWIAKGRIKVNGTIAKKATHKVTPQKKVELGKKRVILGKNVEILYEDRDLIVVHKPANILSVAEDVEQQVSVHRLLKNHKGSKVYPVHRLDKETSGILVFAYSEKARAHFKRLFFDRDIHREYLAVVEGTFDEAQGTWKCYLAEEETTGKIYALLKPGRNTKIATTHYKVLKQGKTTTLLQLKLESGRKHQIRVQAAFMGHPVLGDKRYGTLKGSEVKRLMLHAKTLGFEHPITKKRLEFSAPAESRFQKLM